MLLYPTELTVSRYRNCKIREQKERGQDMSPLQLPYVVYSKYFNTKYMNNPPTTAIKAGISHPPFLRNRSQVSFLY